VHHRSTEFRCSIFPKQAVVRHHSGEGPIGRSDPSKRTGAASSSQIQPDPTSDPITSGSVSIMAARSSTPTPNREHPSAAVSRQIDEHASVSSSRGPQNPFESAVDRRSFSITPTATHGQRPHPSKLRPNTKSSLGKNPRSSSIESGRAVPQIGRIVLFFHPWPAGFQQHLANKPTATSVRQPI
ncbi:hypothetical protein ACLOJK_036529, partial [Asimina triloba]